MSRPRRQVNDLHGLGERCLARSGSRYYPVVKQRTPSIARQSPDNFASVALLAGLAPAWPAAAGATGAPQNLRTRQFYKALQTKLNPGELVAFNVNRHGRDAEDVRNIRDAFVQAYVFPLPHEIVVLGSTDAVRVAGAELGRRGRELDRRFNAPGISFHAVSTFLQRQRN